MEPIFSINFTSIQTRYGAQAPSYPEGQSDQRMKQVLFSDKVSTVWNSASTRPYVFLMCCLIKLRDTVIFTIALEDITLHMKWMFSVYQHSGYRTDSGDNTTD